MPLPGPGKGGLNVILRKGHHPPDGCRYCVMAGVSPGRLGAACLDYMLARRSFKRWIGGREYQRLRAMGAGRWGFRPAGTVAAAGRVLRALELPDGVTTGEAARHLGLTTRGTINVMRKAGFRQVVGPAGRMGRTSRWTREWL